MGESEQLEQQFITVGGEEINLRDYIPVEEHYQFIMIALSQRDDEIDNAQRALITDMNDRFEAERQQYRDQLTNADVAADAKYSELYEQFHNIKNKRDDLERKHQAATSEIESLKQQLEILNNRAEAPKQTNIDGNLAEARRKANEAKRAIYNVVNDSANINYTAQFVDTNEMVTDKIIYIGKYRQLSDEETARFRAELEAAEAASQAELESIPEAVEPVEVDFRESIEAPELQETYTDSGVVGDTSETTSVSDHDGGTVEERLAALEFAVFGSVRAAA